MSEFNKCPKCSREMEVGYLSNAQYWRHGRSIWSFGGMEESLATNVGIVAMWNSILRSKEKRASSYE